MSQHSAIDDGLLRTVALSIGFFALAGSALVARGSPATGYEVSMYAMTPSLVWVGLMIAMAVALTIAFVPLRGEPRGGRPFAIALGGLTMVVFAALPIIRGYRFQGHYDALTHLGWARGISEGTMSPFELFYPAIHVTTVFINTVIEIPLSRAMLFVVLISMLVFCVFVPLCVGTIVGDQRAAIIAAFAGFLLLPITTISMYLEAHAMSQAVFFSALLLFVFVKYVRSDLSTTRISAIGAAFSLTGVAAVVYHPQLVVHLIAAFVGICAIQFLAKRISADGQIAGQTPVYGHTIFLVGLFLVWSADHGFFGGMFEHFIGAAVDFFRGSGSAGDTVATQGMSLNALGSGLLEVFLKLFTPHLVFALLVGGLVLGLLFRRDSHWFERVSAEVTYFVVALIVLVPVFGAYVFAPGSSMFFRVFGLMMVFVTILGAIALHGLSGRLLEGRPTVAVAAGPLLAVGFTLLLVLSLVAIVPSPYTYNASPHVSETTMSGYETAFDNRDDEIDFLGLRDGPNRYDDAVNGNENRSWAHADVDAAEFREGVSGQYETDRYLALTQIDHERELDTYDELRYTETELEAVADEPGVNRIQSNGEFDLYYVPGATSEV
ncbi:DUF6541 family protein [Natronolimnobius baerhuensis]|uniref:Uncharacterized protein n=1 Tax=Natronolimnobius baerhuensis TaxID=253108 RepID=A0A202ECL8_9EURY|nr:DUF6541 family protein [Natronolimnobius baerhuensis]OVE85957.1 hypothetical protein B2G88_03895 [Natronolimnobius baerhuensis]